MGLVLDKSWKQEKSYSENFTSKKVAKELAGVYLIDSETLAFLEGSSNG